MGELVFDSKENNNRRREKAFLALSANERFRAFLRSFDEWDSFTSDIEPEDKGNFVIEKKDDAIRG